MFVIVMVKKFKELFASTLNGIPISVRCVSSMIVALNAKFADYLRLTQTKNTVRNEDVRQQCHVLLDKTHKRLTFIAALTVHTETSLLYTFQQSMQANTKISTSPKGIV